MVSETPLCLKCSRPVIFSGDTWKCLPCELSFTREQLATFRPGEWGQDDLPPYRSQRAPGPWITQRLNPRKNVTLRRVHWAVGQGNPPHKGVALVFGDDDSNAKLVSAAPDLAEAWEPSDGLGLLYHLELACRVLEGAVSAESVDVEGLTGYIRRRAGVAREALCRAGLLSEEG
jgi:hypothetical protein